MNFDDIKTDNPFYNNYVFSKSDLDRVKIKWWEYPQLWFRKGYIQINDGYVFHYKTTNDGRVYLTKVEPFEPFEI